MKNEISESASKEHSHSGILTTERNFCAHYLTNFSTSPGDIFKLRLFITAGLHFFTLCTLPFMKSCP